MAIIDALASGDELTATECAELTGLSPSATAYHLKLLERYDFAEPAPARQRRTGKAVAGDPTAGRRSTSTRPLRPGRRRRPPSAWRSSTAPGRWRRSSSRPSSEEPEEWRDVASLANTDLWLTAEETREVTAALAAVLDPYRDRALADRPDGTRRVRIMNLASPHRRPH